MHFMLGTQWMQLENGFIQGPNVYNVLCPGRFNLLWASVGSEITCVGKLRKNNFMSTRYKDSIKSINEDVLWPDAWKITIRIKDLTPNNFNMYMNYYFNGYEASFDLIRNITDKYNEEKISEAIREKAKSLLENTFISGGLKKLGIDTQALKSSIDRNTGSTQATPRGISYVGKGTIADPNVDTTTRLQSIGENPGLQGYKEVIADINKKELEARAKEEKDREERKAAAAAAAASASRRGSARRGRRPRGRIR